MWGLNFPAGTFWAGHTPALRVTNGGDHPSWPPRAGSVLLREAELRPHHEPVAHGDNMAQAAGLMTDTRYVSSARKRWPGTSNVPVAEDMSRTSSAWASQWSAEDQTLAKALQAELKFPQHGLAEKVRIEDAKKPPRG